MTAGARRIVVVAGLIASASDERYLVSKRPDGTHLAGAWELPGGKVEPGEAPEVALARELREELGIEVTVQDVYAIGHHVYPEKEVLLLVYRCAHTRGEPRALEVAAFRWVTAAELLELPLPPADRPVLDRLRREQGEST